MSSLPGDRFDHRLDGLGIQIATATFVGGELGVLGRNDPDMDVRGVLLAVDVVVQRLLAVDGDRARQSRVVDTALGKQRLERLGAAIGTAEVRRLQVVSVQARAGGAGLVAVPGVNEHHRLLGVTRGGHGLPPLEERKRQTIEGFPRLALRRLRGLVAGDGLGGRRRRLDGRRVVLHEEERHADGDGDRCHECDKADHPVRTLGSGHESHTP